MGRAARVADIDGTGQDDETTVKWYADDFETTTDLDGEPKVWFLTREEAEENRDLEPGKTRLRVKLKTKDDPVTRTITYRRQDDGKLTATTRTGRARVWSWAIREVGGPGIWRGATLYGWVQKACELGGIHWFHNLRFDGAFSDSYFQDGPGRGLSMHAGTWRTNQTPVGCFSALISDTGAHYSRFVRVPGMGHFEMRDSLKKFPATTIAALAKMFGAPNPKGVIDYEAERPEGYQPTADEWEYLETDVEILATALLAAQEAGALGLTIGGDAIKEYRRTMDHGKFRSVFPIIDRETDDFIRRAYRGGWTWINPEHQGLVLEAPEGEVLGAVEDVNSMYPAVMHQSPYPVGAPVRLAPGQHELKGFPHVIYGALLDATIKPGKFPMLQVKKDARYNPVQYQTAVDAIEWYGTEVDWQLLYDQYDVRIHEWTPGLAFASQWGLFTRYVDKWMAVKEEAGRVMEEEKRAGRVGSPRWAAASGRRTQAKFQLNNLWGRFAINPLRASRTPGIDEDGTPTYSLNPQEYGDPCYTPVGVWTTSYGRDRVIRAAQSFGPDFLAADTDSVHHLGLDSRGLEMHDTKLGAWAREAIFTKATYLRAKAYAEEIDGEVEAHVAGLPRQLLGGMRVEDLTIGARFSGKLVPRKVPGGIILESTDFVIGERDAWGHRS
jgi:hypothetical protein